MIERDFEKRLKAMRKKYVENFPQDEALRATQMEAFKNMTVEQKEERLRNALQILVEKKGILTEKYKLLKANGNEKEVEEMQERLSYLINKQVHLEEKLSLIRSNSLDEVKKERLKRQLTILELKRCKARLDKKHCNKIDEKIAAKKEHFLKNFT